MFGVSGRTQRHVAGRHKSAGYRWRTDTSPHAAGHVQMAAGRHGGQKVQSTDFNWLTVPPPQRHVYAFTTFLDSPWRNSSLSSTDQPIWFMDISKTALSFSQPINHKSIQTSGIRPQRSHIYLRPPTSLWTPPRLLLPPTPETPLMPGRKVNGNYEIQVQTENLEEREKYKINQKKFFF